MELLRTIFEELFFLHRIWKSPRFAISVHNLSFLQNRINLSFLHNPSDSNRYYTKGLNLHTQLITSCVPSNPPLHQPPLSLPLTIHNQSEPDWSEIHKLETRSFSVIHASRIDQPHHFHANDLKNENARYLSLLRIHPFVVIINPIQLCIFLYFMMTINNIFLSFLNRKIIWHGMLNGRR